jgi:ATP-dependent RNA helicase SUPV3L1/SUV3
MRRLAARTAHAALAAQAAPCTRGLSASAAAQRSAAQRAAAPLEPPAEWYPAARAARRRIILHVGPPNSGKTHAALAALCAAPSGTYCAPLRLLAWEAAERVAAAGTPCSLLTGQERRKIPGARHVACTVEMADVAQPVAVAVIDEIQLLADPRRGWAFTRALLGVPADEVHVCGDGAAAALVAALAADAGETVEVVRYERLLPLRAARAPLRDVGDVRAGDALVAFSRREARVPCVASAHARVLTSARTHADKRLHRFRRCMRCALLSRTARSSAAASCTAVCRPPCARRRPRSSTRPAAGASAMTALTVCAMLLTLFSFRCSYGVLASSDVIGMGLNLSIKRVVFASLHKFDGSARRLLTAPEVRQIAGRAGRYGGRYAAGEATTLAEDDLPLLHAALAAPPVELSAAGVFPPSDAILAAAAASPRDGLEGALRRLAAAPPSAPHYAQHQPDDVIALAKLLAPLALPLPAALTLALAPCDAREPAAAAAMLRYATALADGRPVRVDTAADVPLAAPRTQAELAALEEAFRTFDLYVWLSLRMARIAGTQAAHTLVLR